MVAFSRVALLLTNSTGTVFYLPEAPTSLHPILGLHTDLQCPVTFLPSTVPSLWKTGSAGARAAGKKGKIFGAGGLDVARAKKPDQRSRDERQAPFSLHCSFLATRVMSYYSWDPLLFGSSCLFSLVLKEPSLLMYLISW